MQEKYQKICIEKNNYYKVYYGIGIFHPDQQGDKLHYDSDITISYFKKCDAELKVEGKRYTVKSGDVVIMNPNEVHCCTVEDNSFHECISLFVSKSIINCLPFNCKELFDCFFKHKDGGNLIPVVVAKKCFICHTMEDILSLSQTKTELNRALCTCKIIELLSQLNDAAVHRLSLSVENPTVARIIEYIGLNFTQNITCTHIAEKFYISQFRLEHLFKECVGVSLWEYVIFRRIMFVNELLQNGETVSVAALKAGFHNYSNFYRLYKKHIGITPVEYKQQYQKQRKN